MLRASGICVRFDGLPAVDDATIDVAGGETLAVLGPSGCGKSTLLRVIAGLQRPDEGRVELDGRDVGGVPAHRRGVGMMFQDDVLFPHRDVAGNVAFGLRMARHPATEIERRVGELLDLVGLGGMGQRSVTSLSGGERERVALARALAPEPRVLLLDEPLGSLDRPLHDRLLSELEDLFSRLGLTVVAVTHDVADAFALGGRVAVMRAGRVVQAATPDRLWAEPADAWVARFLGHANIEEHADMAVVTRPEAVRLTVARGGAATIVSAERRGPLVRLCARLDGGGELEAVTTSIDHPDPGDRVNVEIDPAGVVTVPTWSEPTG
jgi:thiamine transport system ATP-binding protein